MDIADSKGQDYVVNNSFGSLWYIMPYAFFKLMHSAPSPFLLQVFNLLLHLLVILLVYQLSRYLFITDRASKQKAFIVSAIYMFSPAPLWFHGNGYMHEIMVLPFIYSSIILYFHIIRYNSSPGKYFLLALMIIGGINCDWLMCFVAACMFINSLADYIKTRQSMHIKMLVVLCLAVMLALSIIVAQFSLFMGFENYIQSLISRFLLRGLGGDTQGGGLAKGTGISSFYVAGYGLILPFIILSLLVLKHFRESIQGNIRLKCFLIFSLTVCFTHHVMFWGFTNIHDYSVIKTGVPLSLLACIVIFSLKSKIKKMVVMIIIIVTNISIYYFVNPPGKYAANGQPYSYFQTLGEKIKAISTPNDYIFVDIPEMSLLLTYYSKRSYKNVRDINEARRLFKSLPGDNALFIHTSNFEFVNYDRLKK